MSSYIIKFTNTSGESGTVIADAGFNYTDKLNAINDANIKITGSSVSKRSLIEVGSEVFISRNGTLEFHGLVNGVDFLDGGGISVLAQGFETWTAKENGDYANSPWDNIASATIFSELIGESNYFTAGTIDSGIDIDYRAATTESLWNIINNLRTKTSQDIGIDYANSEIDILDHKGSSSSVATFNSNIQIRNMRVSQSYPLGNDVRVYGKGDGDNQITSNFSTAGQDATSKSNYGTIRKIVRDPSVLTSSEGDRLANALVATYKDPVNIYDFDVINPNQSVVSGDVLTLNAPSQGLDNEEVRIVIVERGVRGGNEYLTLEVTNKEYSILVRNTNEIIAQIQKNARDQQTYMQGTTNILTFSDQINADNSASLKVLANISPNEIFDEAGKRRINSFTLDYDVDPYRRGVGDASEDNIAPGVSGSSESIVAIDYTKTDVQNNTGCNNNVWTSVAHITSASFGTPYNRELYGALTVEESSGGPEDIYIRVTNSFTGVEFLAFVQNFDSAISGDFLLAGIGLGQFDDGFDFIDIDVKPVTGFLTIDAIFNLGVDKHEHADGTYGADSHNHSVSVGDSVSDAGSINASQVSIYLDFWNGSSWINKHSILNTGKTLDIDVDISDGNTYPDASGLWRTRILTNSSSPDLVKGIIKCRHNLDT